MPSAPSWLQTPLRDRLRWSARFRALLAADAQHLADLAQREIAKPPVETLAADIMPVLACCRRLERRAARLLRPRRLGGAPPWLPGVGVRVHRVPLGAVGIIATWNYPIGLLGVQMAQALVAGNRVIVKPSERAPDTQRRLCALAAHALAALGLDPAALAVRSHERDAGRALAESGEIDHLIFTGSTEVGRAIAQALAPRLVTSDLELSGRDSALVLADADPRLAARVLVTALDMNAGQTCMAPRRVLVEGPIFEAFCDHARRALSAMGPRPLVDAHAADHGRRLHAEALARGGRDLHPEPQPASGPALRPALVVTGAADALVEGRHFGPLAAVVRVDSLEQALSIHRACDQHLATSVFTRAPRRHAGLATRLRATSVTFNDCIIPTAHPGAAIGGAGPSGWGLTQGDAGLLALTRPVHVSRTHPRVRIPPAPPDPAQARWLLRSARWLYGRPRGELPPHPDAATATLGRSSPAQEP